MAGSTATRSRKICSITRPRRTCADCGWTVNPMRPGCIANELGALLAAAGLGPPR
jgi:hypothetical protein